MNITENVSRQSKTHLPFIPYRRYGMRTSSTVLLPQSALAILCPKSSKKPQHGFPNHVIIINDENRFCGPVVSSLLENMWTTFTKDRLVEMWVLSVQKDDKARMSKTCPMGLGYLHSALIFLYSSYSWNVRRLYMSNTFVAIPLDRLQILPVAMERIMTWNRALLIEIEWYILSVMPGARILLLS